MGVFLRARYPYTAGRRFFLQKSWPRVGTGDSSPADTVPMPLVDSNGHVDTPVWFNGCKSHCATPKNLSKLQLCFARENVWRHTFLIFVRVGGATFIIRTIIL